MIPVFKKLASLLLSLLICLSLLPGQAGAADVPENEPPVQTEAPEPVRPDDPDELVMLLCKEDFPEEGRTDHLKD